MKTHKVKIGKITEEVTVSAEEQAIFDLYQADKVAGMEPEESRKARFDLEYSDQKMASVLDELIGLLVANEVIAEHDLSTEAVKLINKRKEWAAKIAPKVGN